MVNQFRRTHSKAILLLLSATLLLALATSGCDGDNGSNWGGCEDGTYNPWPTTTPAPGDNGNRSTCQVTSVPADVRTNFKLTNFYQKYASANGIPIVTSNQPDDEAIIRACELVIEMTSERDDVRQALIKNRVHFSLIGVNEQITDIPEYSYLPAYYNIRARGLGGSPAVCAEENILCERGDLWAGENICVHEYSHTISVYGLYDADPTFESRLKSLYRAAQTSGTYRNTYAMDNEQEYWAEGVQDWYDTNLESIPANGVHNFMNTRAELLQYDPNLYNLINELLPEDTQWYDCYNQ